MTVNQHYLDDMMLILDRAETAGLRGVKWLLPPQEWCNYLAYLYRNLRSSLPVAAAQNSLWLEFAGLPVEPALIERMQLVVERAK